MTKLMHWIGVTALLAANSPIAAQNTDMAGVDPADEVIYLDVTDEYRDPWSALRNTEADAEREPGLIQIGRLGRPGVRSLFGLPVALTPEYLRAAKVDVAMFGAPIDMGYGWRGAGEGPAALRGQLRGGSASVLPHMHGGGAWLR